MDSYRQTPHYATRVPTASMVFRDGMKSAFPRRALNFKKYSRIKGKETVN